MRSLIMWNLITLDGCFEGTASWDLGFLSHVWGDELEELSIEQLRSADALVFGRVTYEGMAAHWSSEEGVTADLMNSLPKLVCSRSLERAQWNNTTVAADAASAVAELKRTGDGNIFVFGSGNLSRTLIQEALFDEYRLGLVPVAIGRGRGLFDRESEELKLDLLDARPLSNSCVIMRYAPG